MAKRRRNKSALIREAIAQQPNATAAQIVESLAARRVRVQPSLVYAVKNADRKPKLNGYASLIKAKRLADAMGGIDKARQALNVLAKLM